MLIDEYNVGVNRYVEFRPPTDLRKWVDCFWTLEMLAPGYEKPHSHHVLPDGSIDVLFELEGSRGGTSLVVGMMTHPVEVRRVGKLNILAVRFRPSGASAFFRDPLRVFTDTEIPLTDLWHDSHNVFQRIASCKTAGERIRFLGTELLSRLRPSSSSRITACEAAIAHMNIEPGIRIDAVCTRLGVSRQALAASFRDYVGISPKLLGRVLRLQHTLRLAEAAQWNDSLSWARFAQEAGYYDQPHLINEFQTLTGKTPDLLLADRTRGFPNFQD